MAATLTKRQREALIAIHTLTLRNGAGPTIREMRNALDVSSDQTVIEMLERLEKGGFITRDKKQARATSLTDAARLALGIVSTGSPAAESPMELDDQEQKVHDRLNDIDPHLGRMYKGALSTLRSSINEDRIAQSAHSLREIIDHLSNKGNAEMPSEVRDQIKKDRDTRWTVHGLRFYFDPQATIAVEQNPYKHLYDEYQKKLQNIAHHNQHPDEASYIELIKSLEYFLLRYVFPNQAEVYKVLEDTLHKGPVGVDAEDLRLLVKKNVESHRFFFKHADAQWLPYLQQHGFLDASWETGEYLARIAPDAPDGVLDVFLSLDIPKDAWGAKTAFAHAASKLPAAHAAKTVEKIVREEWSKEARAALLHYKLRDLLNNLLDGKEYGSAAALADSYFDVFPEEYGSYGSRQTRGYVGDWEYDQAMSEMTAKLPAEDALPFLEMLASKLKKVMETVHARGEEGEDDYSYIWRPAIEDHSQNKSYDRIDDSIISGVRDLLEKRMTHVIATEGPEAARKELEAVLANERKFPIMSRFRLHVYRLFPDAFNDEVKREVLNPPLSSSTWHEYSMLVSAHFPHLSSETKQKYYELIDDLDKSEDKYIDSRRARLVGLASEGMGAAEKKKYARFLKLASRIEQPHFMSYSGEATWVGPESPKKEEDLEDKTVEEVLEVLKTWEPKGDQFFGPSRSGFGQVLRGVVGKDPAKYSVAAALFLDDAVRPVYIYNLFVGLAEGLKTNARIDWKQVLDLATGIVERSKSNTLSEVEDNRRDRLETDWDGVMQELARLIVRGLDTNSLPLEERARVWSIIEHVVEHPDPTPEHEEKYGGDNSDPYTMSINTVRGEAMHAVFAYIFWFNRAEKSNEPSWTAHIPDEAKKVLEAHLDPKHDPSLAVRSVYGRFFPWMLSYGGDWAKALIPTIFPADDTDMRYAAWETYLSNLIFEDAYKLLRSQYEMATDDIRKGRVPKRRYWVEATQRLAEHAMIAYAFETDSKDNSFVEYFFASGNSSGKTRGMAVSLGGRAFISRDGVPAGEKTPRIEVLQKFWDWRLEASGSVSELREFGWWAKTGKFEDRWMLERLLRTVEKTRGDVDGEFIVMGSLEALVSDHPLLCAKIAKHIFASSNKRDRYTFLHMGELRTVLTKILQSADPEAMKIARETIDYLLKLGFEEFRDLISL